MIFEQRVTYAERLSDRSEFLSLTTLFFLMSDTPVHVVRDIKGKNFNLEAGVRRISIYVDLYPHDVINGKQIYELMNNALDFNVDERIS